jgi:Arc/MetJ family transcription regulator
MRTNIEIDDELMDAVLKETGLPTKRAAVEEALRTLLRLRRQRKILDYRGAFPDLQNVRDLGDSRR